MHKSTCCIVIETNSVVVFIYSATNINTLHNTHIAIAGYEYLKLTFMYETIKATSIKPIPITTYFIILFCDIPRHNDNTIKNDNILSFEPKNLLSLLILHPKSISVRYIQFLWYTIFNQLYLFSYGIACIKCFVLLIVTSFTIFL